MAVKQSVKFTEDELKSLKSLQNQSQVATLQFGQLYLSKLRLEEQETTLKNQLKQLEQEEAKAAQTLTEKYGKGTIDIESGEFTPTE
tara:strand:- start:494 stop:754 length:261 start_codon:yes stop_codon:yes gene_type:complete